MQGSKENFIIDFTFKFSLKVITYVELLESQKKFVISNQLLKSGTSIGANVREAQNAESKHDFIHKIKIALKEADETEYWLLLARESKTYPVNEELINDIRQIIKILSKIVGTTKRNM
jgi:four helix bundle protein